MMRSISASAIGSNTLGLALLAATLALPCPAADPTHALLDKAGRQVEAFWDEISAVACNESVLQTKIGPDGKTQLARSTDYDYLIILNLTGDDLTIEESRNQRGKKAAGPKLPLLTTGGFATLSLIFHPHFQSSYRFTLLPEEVRNGRTLLPVAFSPIPGARTPAALLLRGRQYPIPWEGTAWIEPDTGLIERIHADVGDSLADLGLRLLAAESTYKPVHFNGEQETFWLPDTALVEARTPLQHWSNLHRFSQYRRFDVSTTVTTQAPGGN